MKKTIFSIAIVAASLLVASCGNKSNEATAANEPATEQTEQVAEEAQAEAPASLADIVAKAKAEGAKWTTDEWKAEYKKALEAYKPFAVAMSEENPANIDMDKIKNEYGDYPALIKEFASTAMQSEGGKAIDEEWIGQTMQELGVPHL